MTTADLRLNTINVYKKYQKEGVEYFSQPKSHADKISMWIVALVVLLVFVGNAILMLTGDIDVQCKDTSFIINATYWTDIMADYSEIDAVTYRSDLDIGEWTNGFGSAKLSIGTFQNEEFGSCTLYAYKDARAFIVLTIDGKTLVIGMSDAKKQKIFLIRSCKN